MVCLCVYMLWHYREKSICRYMYVLCNPQDSPSFPLLDVDECKSERNTCANDTVCFNLDGGYDCRCPHGHNCTGDCIHENKVKHNGQIWVLENDRCSVCSCQVRGGSQVGEALGEVAERGWGESPYCICRPDSSLDTLIKNIIERFVQYCDVI